MEKLRILVICLVLLASHIQGELSEGSMGICEFCENADLVDCDVLEFNITVNCDSPERMCILGIDNPPNDLSVQSVNPGQVCLFGKESDVKPLTETSTTENVTEVVLFETPDYQGDEPIETFRSVDSAHAGEEPPALVCLSCNSSVVPDCLRVAETLNSTKCPKSSQCLTLFQDNHVLRDCSSVISAEQLALCQAAENKSCRICPTPKCNKLPWTQCYHCNSQENPNCTSWTAEQSVPVQTCQSHDDRCSVRVTAGGDTVRECVRASFQCPPAEICSTCDGALCNAGVFPEDRRRCIQCHECEDLQDPSNARPCTRYTTDDQCYLYVTAKSKVMRGCMSNTAEMEQCHLNGPKCTTCGNANGCNNMALMKEPTLSCSKCNSKTDPSCAWAQPATSVEKCQKKVLYYLEETCMMNFDPTTHEATRDCSLDSGVCTPDDRNCHTCTGDGCNRGNLKTQQCIQCSSSRPEQVSCARQAEDIPPSKCPQEAQKYETRGCYAMTKNNITSRGCVVELNADDIKVCLKKESDRCDICFEDGCNNQMAPSGAWMGVVDSVMVVLCVAFISLVA